LTPNEQSAALAAEQETIIQQIAWELFDPTSAVTASYGDAVEIDDAAGARSRYR
jgi:hypothetical protein